MDSSDGDSDLWNDRGAALIKAQIEAYWRERGYEVQVMLLEGPFTAALRTARVDVRSDMINGLPRTQVRAAS